MNPMKDDDVAAHIGRALAADAAPGVVSVYLFGSVAHGRSHRESDLDVAVLLKWADFSTARARFEERLRLSTVLGAGLGRRLDLVVLNDVAPGLGRAVVRDGKRLFCSDPKLDHAYVRDVQLRAADLEPFLRRTRKTKLGAIGRR